MALLLEGLKVGRETACEDYIIISPSDDMERDQTATEKENIKPYNGLLLDPMVTNKQEEWDEESLQRKDGDHHSNDNLYKPLLSKNLTSLDGKDMQSPISHSNVLGMKNNSKLVVGNGVGHAAVSPLLRPSETAEKWPQWNQE